MAKRTHRTNEKKHLLEIEKIEKNSHSFLKYFGVFWGAILVFIVQNYGNNSIAKILGDQMVDFFANPRILNSLGFGLLFVGVLLISISLILLIIAALGGVKFTEHLNLKEKTQMLRQLLHNSVFMGILGSIFLMLLFMVSLMRASNLLASNAELLGKVFFWIIFLSMFLIDPFVVLKHKNWKGFWTWTNLIIAIFVFVAFVLNNILTLPQLLIIVFLFTFLIYVPVRLFLSFWKTPFFFVTPFDKMIPEIPKTKRGKQS